MSLRSDFYALPFLHRIVIIIASAGFALLCGAIANMYQASGVAVAAASGCGGVLLYHVVVRIAVGVFMAGAVKTLQPSKGERARKEDERARKEKEAASGHARSQLARARALMAGRRTGESEPRDAVARPSRSGAAPPAPPPAEPGRSRRRRTFGRRASRRRQ